MRARTLLLIYLAGLPGCSEFGVPNPPLRIADLSVLPLVIGDSIGLLVTLANGDTVRTEDIVWSTSDTAVAVVRSERYLTAWEVGPVTLIARAHGYTATKTLQVHALLVDLGPDNTMLYSINAQGQAVGTSGGMFSGTVGGTAVRTSSDGTLVALPVPAGTESSMATDINDSGVIVGRIVRDGGAKAVIWRDNVMSEVDPLFAHGERANAINNVGTVVGFRGGVPYIWSTSDGNKEFKSPDGDITAVNDVNDAGDVVGAVFVGSGTYRAFILPAGTSTPLLIPGLEFSGAVATNASRQVAGVFNAGGRNHAFRWSDAEGLRDLGSIPNSAEAFAQGMNAQGDVVGYATGYIGGIGFMRAFLWRQRYGMVELLTPESQPSFATAINSSGVVVGSIGNPGRAAMWMTRKPRTN